MGVENERTLRFGHTEMPVFGAGKDIPAKTWQSVYRQLLAAGLVRIDHAAYGALKLEPDARAVFRHERQVFFRKDRPGKGPGRGKSAKGASPAAAKARAALPEADMGLFEELRATRMAIAKSLSVPPYVVFPDTTLTAMAAERPMTDDALLAISGVGQAKLERYGEAFLAVIRGYAG